MLKLVLSIIGGVVIAFAIVFAAEALFHAMTSSSSPLPKEVNDKAAMQAYVAGLPLGILAGLVVSWGLAVVAGSAFASRFGGRKSWPGWVVTDLFLFATIANFMMVTHPVWMVGAAIIVILVAGAVGSNVGTRGLGASRAVPSTA